MTVVNLRQRAPRQRRKIVVNAINRAARDAEALALAVKAGQVDTPATVRGLLLLSGRLARLAGRIGPRA